MVEIISTIVHAIVSLIAVLQLAAKKDVYRKAIETAYHFLFKRILDCWRFLLFWNLFVLYCNIATDQIKNCPALSFFFYLFIFFIY